MCDRRRLDGRPRNDGLPLLLLFIGQFVLVAALVRTGLLAQVWIGA